MKNELCPVCGEGLLTNHTKKVERNHNGVTGLVDLHFSVCSFCECETATDKQMKVNVDAMKKFKENQ